MLSEGTCYVSCKVAHIHLRMLGAYFWRAEEDRRKEIWWGCVHIDISDLPPEVDSIVEKISLFSPEEFSRLNEVLLSSLKKGSLLQLHIIGCMWCEEASAAPPVQLYDPALQGMQVWKFTRGQTLLLAVWSGVLSMVPKKLFQGKAAAAAATIFAYICSSKYETSYFLRITWSLSLPEAKECNLPFQYLEKKYFFQPQSGHCVKEDLAAFLVPWNLRSRRHTGALSEPNLTSSLLKRAGSLTNFGVERGFQHSWTERKCLQQ